MTIEFAKTNEPTNDQTTHLIIFVIVSVTLRRQSNENGLNINKKLEFNIETSKRSKRHMDNEP